MLDDPDGYTAWWLHTRTELGRLRSPDDPTFAGLLDPCTHPSAPGLRAALLHAVRTDADAQVLADALADPARTPAPAVVIAAHRAIAGHRLAELPARVRGIDGQVLDAESAAVLDVAHARFTADALVFGGLDVAADLADTLDLPLAGSEPVEILGSGARFARGAHPGVTLAQALGELPDAAEVEVHDPLEVAVGGTERRVPYVVVDDVLHVQSGGW